MLVGYEAKWEEYVEILKNDKKLFNLNSHFKRNEGLNKSMENDKKEVNLPISSESEKYRAAIHTLIPGGSHTYSKGDDQFPENAPAAIAYGKGAYIWDVDGNKFLDCSMGLSAVTLGHAFEPVLEKVRAELEKGVNFQRPSYIEKDMAESFLSLLPNHDMIKFGKNGSTVTTAAVKLARAHTGRKLVAFPGDHPFYSYDDWFIGKTACSFGVPEEISSLSVTFQSCNIESLKELFEKYPGQIACVITEPEKNFCGDACRCNLGPRKFLKAAIDLTHANGAVFILDEMVTGFKTDFPGSMTKYDLKPDLATWGKGIANGFSFCALTGKREIMELGGIKDEGKEKLFLISSTHGGETHTLAAGIATIDFYKNNNVIEKSHKIGKKVIYESKRIIEELELSKYIEVTDSAWMPLFVFKNKESEVDASYRTLFLQEMIKNGILFQGILVPSFSHNDEEVDYFLKGIKNSCQVYKKAIEEGVDDYLTGSPIKAVFRKYI
jgi:spore coat polysaccharide biosynthesis protein SpsF